MIDLTHEERMRREAATPETYWGSNQRWKGIDRAYSAEDVLRLRGSVTVEHRLAGLDAERLWSLINRPGYVAALGALTGGQAVEMVKAGLKAIYLSGWQVAADANLAGHTYPDQSLYPANSVPQVVRRINNALQRADQIAWAEGETGTYWLAPILADAEAGFGGPLNAFELMRAMIEAGAAGVHFEDQLASEKKCGHLGGKVLVPTSQFLRTLAPPPPPPPLPLPPPRRPPPPPPHERGGRARRRLHHRRTDAGGVLPRARRHGRGRGAGARLRALRRRPLVRDVDAGSRRGPGVRRGRPRRVPRQAPRLQLLALVQLAPPPRRRDDRPLPGRARRARLPLPVHYPRRLPRLELLHVRARRRGRCRGDARLRAPAGAGVRARAARLHGHAP